LELCAGAPAGAGAGAELLHPPKMSVAERAKLAAKTRDFSRIELSPLLDIELKEIYSDRLDLFFKVSHPRALDRGATGSWSYTVGGVDPLTLSRLRLPAKQHSPAQPRKTRNESEIKRGGTKLCNREKS
jgi:hypothetical protein